MPQDPRGGVLAWDKPSRGVVWAAHGGSDGQKGAGGNVQVNVNTACCCRYHMLTQISF